MSCVEKVMIFGNRLYLIDDTTKQLRVKTWYLKLYMSFFSETNFVRKLRHRRIIIKYHNRIPFVTILLIKWIDYYHISTQTRTTVVRDL